MNIFNYINTQFVFIRDFIYPEDLTSISNFTKIEIKKGIFNDLDPVFTQYEPFKKGYNFSFELRSFDNIDYIDYVATNNRLLEVILSANSGITESNLPNSYYRIGDKNGFKITDYKIKYSLSCKKEYIIKLETVKPAGYPYEEISYEEINIINKKLNITNYAKQKNTRQRIFNFREKTNYKK